MKEERDSLHWWIFLCHCTSSDRDRPLQKGHQYSSSLSLFHLKIDLHALSVKLWVISLRRQTISKTLVTCIRTHYCQNSLNLNILLATSHQNVRMLQQFVSGREIWKTESTEQDCLFFHNFSTVNYKAAIRFQLVTSVFNIHVYHS